MRTLHDLYVEQLRDLYDAENQLVRALPKMAAAAASDHLRNAFNDHLDETRNQVRRLEQIFSELGLSPAGERCEAMLGLVKEGERSMHEGEEPDVRDAALIASAQRVEHYEIAGYGTARTFAKQLDYHDAADLLQQSLDEEGAADKKLTKIATGGMFRSGVNQKAKA